MEIKRKKHLTAALALALALALLAGCTGTPTDPTDGTTGNHATTEAGTTGAETTDVPTTAPVTAPENDTTAPPDTTGPAATTAPEETTAEATQPTETTGNSGTSKCSHSYGAWITTRAATCESAGSCQRTCSKCGKTETAAIEALGHNWDGGKTDAVLTDCSQTGLCTYNLRHLRQNQDRADHGHPRLR